MVEASTHTDLSLFFPSIPTHPNMHFTSGHASPALSTYTESLFKGSGVLPQPALSDPIVWMLPTLPGKFFVPTLLLLSAQYGHKC